MRTLSPGLLLLAALLAAVAPARAQDGADDTDWNVEVGNPSSTGTAEGSFSTPETVKLGEQMRQHALDQICRAAQIPIDFSKGVDGLGGGVGLKRSMRVIPNVPGNRLGLVDEERVTADLGHTFQVGQAGDVSFGITLGAHLQGDSLILRPLPTDKACKELKAFINLKTFKSVLPLSASRIQKMEVGELWKLPTLLTIGHSEGATAPIDPYSGVTLSLGINQTGAAIMTVYRVSPEAVRFRFRVEHVRVHNQSGAVTAVYPAALVFSPQAANILMKQLDNVIAGEIAHYLQANFGLFHATADGQQVLMEFVIDPRQPDEVAALEKALRGDLRTLVTMAGRMVKLQGTQEAAQRDFADIDRKNEDIFGKSGNPSLDVYHDDTHGWHLKLPFFVDHTSGRDSRADQISRLTPEGGQFDLYKEDKTSGSGWFEIPIKGQLVKRNTLRSAQTFVYESKDGKVTAPQAVYIYQEGFLRSGADAVREEALEASRLTSLAGARGDGANPRLAAPIDGLLPEPPPPPQNEDDHEGTPQSSNVPTYHDGTITYTLVMTEKAVASVLAATPELLAKCYANTLGGSDKMLFNTALRTARFAADGTMNYDRRDFRRAYSNEDNDEAGAMEQLARVASAIVRDVAAVRDQPTPQLRAAAMSRLMAGKGDSGLEYADIMAVLIQVVDPMDITADLAINVKKGIKGTPDARAHMTLKKDRPDNPLLKDAAAAKQRFAKPSDLVD